MAFRKLLVWQKSMSLARETYTFVNKLPEKERYGLSSQMCRCAVSIPSNIAEGYKRGGDKELKQFLYISRGSAAELQTQALLAADIYSLDSKGLLTHIEEVQKLLEGFIRRL